MVSMVTSYPFILSVTPDTELLSGRIDLLLEAPTLSLPDAIVQQLNAELRKIVDSPDTAKRLIDLGGEPQANTPGEMQRFVENELRKWRSVIDARKIERQ